eukprot:Seg3621.1 transcript_id=Seg3621.1/GoldUCD/mRNA.D3Y31 product="SET and MYND domain-containing protein 4" protein_id=Seg3621.1/GoldUCD/D3Y31
MSSKSHYYASLKKKLEFAVQRVTEEAVSLHASSVGDLKSNPDISTIIADIESAIDERQVLHHDLEKFAEEARIHQRRGEIFQEKKLYQKALNEYSRSLCSIPYNVHNVSRGVQDIGSSYDDDNCITMRCDKKAKRSSSSAFESCGHAVIEALAARAEMLRNLGHHQLALKDIEEALSFRPDREMRSSILQTHKLCLSEMRKATRSQSPRRCPNVAHLPHQSIANASDLIMMNYKTEKGRYLEANGEIKAGDVLIVEKPYASVLLPEFYHSHCYHCIKPLIAPIPCYTCQDVLFCSKECQARAYSGYHKTECQIWPLIQMVDSFAHLAIRILLTAKPDELLGILENEKNIESKCNNIHGFTNNEYKHNYKAVYNLVTNHDLQSNCTIKSNAVVASIISNFFASPQTISSPIAREERLMETKKKKAGIRLSSSSPALFDANCQSNGNLNSLADAFANYQEKENIDMKNNFHLSQSLQSSLSELVRRSSTPADLQKEYPGAANRRRSCAGFEEPLSSGLYQSMLTEDQINQLILRHLQQIACNVHTVTTLALVEEEEDVTRNELNGKQEYSLRKEQRQIALALYPTACLLNHACDPDVIVSFTDSELVVRATHNISQGEEITHCYVPHVGRMQRAARQRMLQKRYFFICSCAACRRDEERERRQLCSLQILCPECRDLAKIEYVDDSFIGRCSNKDCGIVSNVERQLEEIQDSRELFMDAVDSFKSGNIKKSLTTLQQVMKKRSSVLQPKDKHVAEVHDAMSRCYEVLREWDFASYHCSLNLDSVEQQYGETSSECAHAVTKLAQFLYNGKLFDKAGKVIDRGIKLLSLHYGDEYPTVKELTKMKECVRTFASPVSQFSV